MGRVHNGRSVGVRLISVPHSGTRFTGAVLDALGFPLGGGRSEHHTDDLGFPVPYVSEDVKVVVPVRDPMLAEISRKNRGDSGLPVQEWSKVADWRWLGNVFWFRVGLGSGREWELAQLADFLGVEPVDVDWSPVNTSHDGTGFKARYRRGEIPDELRAAFDWLTQAEDVQGLFRWLGYDLPWMA